MTWASEIMQESVELRALSIAIMSTSSSSMYTWAPLVLWPVTGNISIIEKKTTLSFSFSSKKKLLINNLYTFLDAPRYCKSEWMKYACQYTHCIQTI